MKSSIVLPIRAILFDFDGTLTYPGPLDFTKLKELITCPIDTPILEYIQGLSSDQYRESLLLLDRFEMEGAVLSEPNFGAEELIRNLQAKRLPVAIASRNSRAAVLRALENFSCISPSDFSIIISRDTDIPPKPDPSCVKRAAATMDVQVEEMLVVGDFRFDIEAGHSAGAPTVFLTNGQQDPPTSPAPDYVVEKLAEMEALIRYRCPLPRGKLPNEFLSKFLLEIQSSDDSLLIGPGVGEDTAAVTLKQGEEILILKADPITFTTDEMGYYALVVNANDVATSGGSPRWLLTTLLFPPGTTAEQIYQLMENLRHWSNRLGVNLCGGHTEITDAVTKPVVVGQMVGTVSRNRLVDKRQMRTGDQILVTKGVAVEGTAILAREFPGALAQLGLTQEEIERCQKFLFSPGISVLEEATIALESGGVSALHDVTEGGLATALEEIACASQHRIQVRVHQIPIIPETATICRHLNINPLGLIGSGSLLIICRSDSRDKVEQALQKRQILAKHIGEVLGPGTAVEAVDGNGDQVVWPHFEVDELSRAIQTLGQIEIPV